jgi:hypothetical protein
MPQVRDLLGIEAWDARQLSWALCRLAYLGLDRAEPAVAEIAERLLARQSDDASFPIADFYLGLGESRYSMMPLQAAIPLRALAAVGYATDPRVERSYDWLVAQRLDDGGWPVGIAAGQPGYIAGYRKLPGSLGCRVNTEGAVACLVLHPERRRSEPTRTALELLLQRGTREEWSLGSEVARLVEVRPVAGFITSYARFDLAFILELAARAGASPDDTKIAAILSFLRGLRGAGGLWEHPERPDLSRWLTFDLLRTLRRLDDGGDWLAGAPTLPFRAYPRRPPGPSGETHRPVAGG